MPRVARIELAGFPHHITQRGNNRQNVFFVDDDRRIYLEILREQAEKYGLTVKGVINRRPYFASILCF